MTDLDLDAIEARRQVACLPYTTEATISAVLTITRIDVPALVALVRAKESWIDGAKVDMAALEEAAAKATTWHMEALDDLAACVAERDEARAEVERLREGVRPVYDQRYGDIARRIAAAETKHVAGTHGPNCTLCSVIADAHLLEAIIDAECMSGGEWDRLTSAAWSQRDDWRRRYEALRDGVTGLTEDEWGSRADETERCPLCRRKWSKHTDYDGRCYDGASTLAGYIRDLRAVVARVEESATEYVPCGCDFHGDHAGCDATCATRGCSDPQTQEG